MKKFLFLILLALAWLGSTDVLWAQAAKLRSGPMLGYSAMREVMVWAQLKQAGTVEIRYWPVGQRTKAQTSKAYAAKTENDLIVHIPISYLEPGTKYDYEVLINRIPVARPYALQFQTNPLWQWRTDPPEFNVAFGSCAYINETPYDRPGRAYGGETKIFRSIAEKKPDLMLWLGDNDYYREVDWDSPTMMRYRMAHGRQTPEMQPLLARTHNYAIWDDHDYGPNDADRSYILKDAALEIFKDYWANPAYGFKDTPGVFHQFSWGDADFFMLDDRYHRAPNAEPDTSRKTILGKAQLDWLIDALSFSKATFKIVAIGGQVLNQNVLFENYSTYPAERRYLLNEITKRNINGVVFLSGDRHHTVLRKVERAGSYTLYDFTSSPLTSGVAKPQNSELDAQIVGNTLVTEQNFGVLSFSGKATDRVLTMKTFDANGVERWSFSVKASDLKAK